MGKPVPGGSRRLLGRYAMSDDSGNKRTGPVLCRFPQDAKGESHLSLRTICDLEHDERNAMRVRSTSATRCMLERNAKATALQRRIQSSMAISGPTGTFVLLASQ
jgi:hypothetical protein